MKSLIKRDEEVQAAADEVKAAFGEDGTDYDLLCTIAAFVILEDGQNVYDLVEPILKAGARMEFASDDLFETYDGSSSYYFVGRKPAVIEKIRSLLS